jgi:hypothetical protein
MRKSSINFEPAGSHNFRHNDRTEKEPSYLLPVEYREENEVLRSAKETEAYLDELINEAKKNYQKKIGQKLQAKKFVWEGVVNLEANHTLEDLKKLAKAIEEETGFSTLQIAIHRDEGYINSRGFPVYNYHAHISFFTLDRETGQQLWRRQVTKKQRKQQPNLKPMNGDRLSKLQDITADVLNMKRGTKGSRRKHIEPALYRELKAQEELINKLQNEAYRVEIIADEHGCISEISEIVEKPYKEIAEELTLALEQKDAQIADLEAEIAKLKAQAIEYIDQLQPEPYQAHINQPTPR